VSNGLNKIGKKKGPGRFHFGKLRRQHWQDEQRKAEAEREAAELKRQAQADLDALSIDPNITIGNHVDYPDPDR
jgi:hypothetical protein